MQRLDGSHLRSLGAEARRYGEEKVQAPNPTGAAKAVASTKIRWRLCAVWVRVPPPALPPNVRRRVDVLTGWFGG